MKLNNLKTKYLAKNYEYYDYIDSTQKEIWRRIDSGIINGTMIIAGIQTEGIGTHGRKWYTEYSNNIAFSFYIESQCKISNLNNITIQIAEILVSIFYNLYNIKLEIKEPNDLYYNNKKIGGILTESKSFKNIIKFLVIGIGINTSQQIFNKNIANIASSIKNEFNINIDSAKVITEFCNIFENKFNERIKK